MSFTDITRRLLSRRAAQLDDMRLQSDPAVANEVQPADNPHLSAHNYQGSLGRDVKIKYGHIQMAMPHANWYRVALDDGGGVLPCCRLLPDATAALFGTHDACVFEPGTGVFVLLHPTGVWGHILGAMPERMVDGNQSYADNVVQGSHAGLHRSPYYHKYISQLRDGGGVIDFSNSRALDELIVDWGRATDTGLRMHLDPFMLSLRVNEFCGLSGFYLDDLMRLRGYNLDVESACHSEEYRDDEGEATFFRGETPYPWEGLGCFDFGTDVTVEKADKDVIHKGHVGKLEPTQEDLSPFFRYQEYGGYLGQGRLRLQMIPPKGKVGSAAVNRQSDTDPPLGVFREQVLMNGQYILESAKSLVFAKRTVFPVPKRVRQPNDRSDEADGTGGTDYKFAGQHGSGPEHEIGELTTTDERPNLLKAFATLDLHSYLFNWVSNLPFLKHTGDFDLPEESDLAEGQAPYLPPFGNLASDMYLPEPSSARVETVDHRHSAKYYNVMSHMTFLDDGGIVIQGGQGEEIRLVGGSVEISCPGNIVLKPGKSVVALSGDDLILRAYKSVDITSSDADIRLKAEHNMQMIAGNAGDTSGGTGSMLLENRSATVRHHYPDDGGESIRGSGIIFKAPNSQVTAMAQEIYLRTGSSPNIGSGSIVLDADKGNANIRMVAGTINRQVRSGIRDSFGLPSVTSVNQYVSGASLLGGSLRCDGSLQADGSGTFNGTVTAVSGHFQSPSGGYVGSLRDRPLWLERMQQLGDAETQLKESQQLDYDQTFKEGYYRDGQIGNSQMQKKISGSLRTEEQYGTSNFWLAQSHWQVLNEEVGAGVTWKEPSVRYQDSESKKQQPWPGGRAWTGATMLTFGKDQLKMFDLASGHAKDRDDEAYVSRELGSLSKKAPSENYKIIPAN